MKPSKFTESQILSLLKEFEAGMSAADVCRQHNISQSTLYKWKSQYSGMNLSELKRLKALEEENRRLKKMYAEARIDNELIEKKL